MRRCNYCGQQYADKVTVCPLDDHPTVNPEEHPKVPGRADHGPAAFDVKVTSPMSAAGSFKVFVRGSDLLFIQTDSETRTVLNALVPVLGPAGNLIPLFTWLFSRRRAKDYLARLQTDDPENLLRDNDKNFRLHLGEIREAQLEPPPRIMLTGKAIGAATLLIRHNEMLKLAFPTRADMDAAWQLLAPALQSALRVTVEWSVTADQYQKLAPQKH